MNVSKDVMARPVAMLTSVKLAVQKIAGRSFAGAIGYGIRTDAVLQTGRGQQYRRTNVSKSTLDIGDGISLDAKASNANRGEGKTRK